jgi:hypothetical protein
VPVTDKDASAAAKKKDDDDDDKSFNVGETVEFKF